MSNLWSYYWQPDERNHDFPSLAKFLHELSQRHFSKIVSDSSHPFFSRVSFNTCWMSSRNKTIYKTGRCRTQRRAKSFFPFFMSERNRWFFIILLYFCFNLLVNIRYYRFCDRECEIKLNWTFYHWSFATLYISELSSQDLWPNNYTQTFTRISR